ncbi:MAG: hypothetical protein CMG00_08810 [Candidatus Marinimicrobia bacterium]|nr:hypothetical protein [Candidatus Neomarinimicrobiota bacterium]|tara:strand:+ start:6995 stop:10114 length:3120 start_codon:yes stop_codon:yes gene_type:complete
MNLYIFREQMTIKSTYIFIFFVFLGEFILAQFGQNIAQYKKFDWKYIQTKYFDIYFYEDGQKNTYFLDQETQVAHDKISNYMNWTLKDRYTIIIHNSHNDFQQTNVVTTYMQEGIGGVTELYKNRIVIPFDGSLKDFKHVIHHEMVHLFINDMLYGGTLKNMIYSNVKPIPLWMNEGLAEYLASKWTSNSEMWARDLAINGGELPNFNELNGYLAYRGGHSIWNFITSEWGEEIIAEILWEIKRKGTVEKAIEASLGVDMEDLLNMWHKNLKDLYWPEIKSRNNLNEISKKLIDHKKLNNSYNISPSISPTGEKFALYSNKSGNMGIYLVSTIDGKFIKKIIDGESSSKFEELHILKPGISWSPNGEKITFSAKSGESDVLFILDLITDKLEEFRFDLEGIFQPAWNTNSSNDEIAFIGNNGYQSDIYLYNYKNDDLINLTNDWFSESDISWSTNGQTIYFISNREKYSFTNSNLNQESLINTIDCDSQDIYTINKDTRIIKRITDSESNESYPQELSDGESIIYLSDESGISNIYVKQDTLKMALTNISTGITQFILNKKNNQILLCGLEESGYNIYSISNPLKNLEKNIQIPKSDWVNNDLSYTKLVRTADKETNNETLDKRNYQNFVFNNLDSSKVKIPTEDKEQDRVYNNTIYSYDKPRFTLDFMQLSFSLDLTYDNTQGMAQILFSDILGNHRVYINTEAEVDFKNSDYMIEYHLLPRRLDWFFKLYHYAYLYFDSSNGINNELFNVPDFRLEDFGIDVQARYPINRFSRYEFSINLHHTLETQFTVNNYYVDETYSSSQNILQPYVKYVWDNTKWRGFHPIKGTRLYLKYRFTPKSNNSDYFRCATIDLRSYKDLNLVTSFASRLFIGKFWGNSDYNFKLGGVPAIFSEQDNSNNSVLGTNRYFSEYIYPLRGIPLGARNGNNVMLINLEYRLPFLLYYFPTIKWLGQLNGVLFTDIGLTWNKDFPNFNDKNYWGGDLSIESNNSDGWSWTYGFGPRFVFFNMPWQLDYTWQYYPISGKSEYRGWYISIGFDF